MTGTTRCPRAPARRLQWPRVRPVPDVRSGLPGAAAALAVLAFACGASAARAQDPEALTLAQRWQSDAPPVILSPEGRVLFAYGQSRPTIVCAIFTVCDLALEPGEIVEAVNIGDSQRWDIVQARSGSGDAVRDHIVIKPLSAGIRTTLFVGTDRRSYMIELVGSESEAMSQVGFLYGGARAAGGSGTTAGGSDIELLPPPPRPAPPPTMIPVASAPVGDEIVGDNLDFDYRIGGDRVPWRPVRVFDDGRRTFIDFDPERIDGRELPVFLVNDTDARGAMINYRYDTRGRIVVDGLFDRGTLMLGKGRGARKVSIERDADGGRR